MSSWGQGDRRPQPKRRLLSRFYNPADNRSALYQRFYKQLHKAPAGYVVLSVSNQSMSLFAGPQPLGGNDLPAGGVGPDPGPTRSPLRRFPFMYSRRIDQCSSVLVHSNHIFRIPQSIATCPRTMPWTL
ncbi:uncharacterized protein si:ch211-216l23.2 isoform X2 [Oncorhynchus keta]|uniref:uncharacterized protein si:ch211-216l23.2 isoform X2 n=1 Tax=Oncorhynchus keta TaxID=8018 RepID=UPI0015FDF8B8|nr:uncharacterized protein si:ch211-216l23.2 isoform X2 [Oncorhynchus keta]